MKRATALILLVSILSHLIGYYPLFFVLQLKAKQAIKTQLKNQVDKKNLHVFKFESANEINWKEAHKEFEYNQHYYDVVYTQKTETGITYYCISDEQETRLFANLDNLIRQKNETPNSPLNQTTKQLFKLLTLAFINTNTIGIEPIKTTVKITNNYNRFCLNVFIKIDTPPPLFV